jgi:peptidoglycan/xylan/chitin deacetylase (PgdA/CDA1 family)
MTEINVNSNIQPGEESNRGIILMYHRVADLAIDPWGMSLSPDDFQSQLVAIRQHTTPMSLAGLVQAKLNNNVPKNACAVTFDDGYLDNLTHAKPLLQEFEIPATVFVTTGYIGHDGEFWWDALEKVFLHTDPLPEILRIETGEASLHLSIGTAATYTDKDLQADCEKHPWQAPSDSRMGLFFETWKFIRNEPHSRRLEITEELMRWAGRGAIVRECYRPMSNSELNNICDDGLISIGAHTVTHPSLPKCTEIEKREEIFKSKQELEKLLARDIDHFAYPHGDYDDETIAIVRAAGFKSACVTHSKTGNQIRHDTGIYELPRIHVSQISAQEFSQKITHWFRA